MSDEDDALPRNLQRLRELHVKAIQDALVAKNHADDLVTLLQGAILDLAEANIQLSERVTRLEARQGRIDDEALS